MKISITTATQSLPEIMWDDFATLVRQKTNTKFIINVQNLTEYNVYAENINPATITDWYKISAWNEVAIATTNLNTLNFISEWGNATDVRIMWT